MAITIENLEKAFDEMFDFITDLPSGLDGFESDFDAAFEELKELKATLTPPNEAPPCYQPDGDGCAYQCYDGDDEPIEKCKECPLCYSDKQRHYTPPNDPLTPSPDGDTSIIACPRCGSGEYLHNEDGNEQNYCGKCGQAIDWSRPPERQEDTP